MYSSLSIINKMISHKTNRLLQSVFIILLAGSIAVIGQALLVKQYGVNVPFWDEWSDNPTILAQFKDQNLNWTMLFQPHNEHRIVTTRIALIASFFMLGEWNTQANMFVSSILIGVITIIWSYTLVKLQFPKWIAVVSAALLISPAQYQNIAWGFQTSFYFTVLSIVAGISIITCAKRVSYLVLLSSILCCVIANFSLASGILAWPIIAGCLFCKVILEEKLSLKTIIKKYWAEAIIFIVISSVSVYYYLYGLQLTSSDEYKVKSISGFIKWIVMAMAYPFFNSGNHFFIVLLIASLVQWIPIIIVFIWAIKMWKIDNSSLYVSIITLYIGIFLFVMLNAAIIAYGRGNVLEITSRYTTIFVWISLICITSIGIIFERRIISNIKVNSFVILFSSLILIFELFFHHLRSIDGLNTMHNDTLTRSQGRAYIESFLAGNTPKAHVTNTALFPWPEELEKRLLDPRIIAILPTYLQMPEPDSTKWSVTGDAWSVNGLSPAAPLIPYTNNWGSWGSNQNIGTLTSPSILITHKYLSIPIVGYPNKMWGNTLEVVADDNQEQRVVFSGPDPGYGWQNWRVDMSEFASKRIRIVAHDGSDLPGVWLGVAWPTQSNQAMLIYERIYNHLELIGGFWLIILFSALLMIHYTSGRPR